METKINMKRIAINFIIGIVCLVLDGYFINNLFFEVIIALLLTMGEFNLKKLKVVFHGWKYFPNTTKCILLLYLVAGILMYSMIFIIIKKPINIIIYVMINSIIVSIYYYKHIDDV